MHQVPLLINGEFVQSASNELIDVINPANQEVLAQVPCTTDSEMDAAIASASETFKTWKDVPITERARIMMKYAALLKEHHDELATIICHELGKTFEDAKGDVWRGIEVVEQAANAPSLMMGETMENVARKIDTYSYMQPLGVCAGITPFNFPAMIPLWMFPLAIVCGNTFILKPSEQDPLTPMRLAELFIEAGAPKGVLQVVHGTKPQVDRLLEDKAVRAISFVGSCGVGAYIYSKGTQNLKRVQACVGAKNHMVIMPDASKSHVVNNLVGASVGAAGQRCMGISVAVFVGPASEWVDEIKAGFKNVRPGVWDDKDAAYGPQTSKAAKERILSLIASGKEQGATCLIDGSNYTVEGFDQGNWVGPTLFTDVTKEMDLYKEEIFGPVMSVLVFEDEDDVIVRANGTHLGLAAGVFTSDIKRAHRVIHQLEAGICWINAYGNSPAEMPVGGYKQSGIGRENGIETLDHYTQTKSIYVGMADIESPF
jgi:malonate-semialdehyde dehydrogenase (acetylating)/methylmalonate-semialdehyde dehydrogenase